MATNNLYGLEPEEDKVSRKGYAFAFAAVLVVGVMVGGLAALMGAKALPQAEAEGLAAAAVAVAMADRGATAEGIKAHGSWTIEVRGADGTLAERREFENAITAAGAYRINEFLGHIKTPGPWLIVLSGSSASTDPCEYLGNPEHCEVTESTWFITGDFRFRNLQVSVPTTGTNANKLVLTGTATALRDGDIGKVETANSTCPGTVTTQACTGDGGYYTITSTTLTPISVLDGQSILVTVVINFS